MTITSGMTSSNSDEWTTPRWLFDRLDSVFHFTLDAAATSENRLCGTWCGSDDDGLAQSWEGERVFCNPPYSQISLWAHKFASEAKNASLIVALVPARVDTRWWQDYVAKADLVHFIRGRLRFGDSKNSAPFPSALAFWFGLDALLERPKRSKSTCLPEISGSGSPNRPA